jgi:hypothetical protein
MLLAALAASTLLTACVKKKVDKDIVKSRERLIGVWNVNEINVFETDTFGTLLSDTTMSDMGTLEFRYATDQGLDLFDAAAFRGACATMELPLYFRQTNSGEVVPGGYEVLWEADPEDMRVMLWGISGGGNYHRGLNLAYDGDGDDNQRIFYVLESKPANRRTFYTWRMTK